MAEPVESGKPLGTFLRKVRRQDGSFTARKLTLDGIPGNGHKLYGWLKATADSLLPVPGQGRALPHLGFPDGFGPDFWDKSQGGTMSRRKP